MNDSINEQDNLFKELLPQIIEELSQKFGAHTFILYGSLARGDFGPQSDLDLAVFAPVKETSREAKEFQGIYLDAWIYPETKAQKVDVSLLHINEGMVLQEKAGLGTEVLKQIKELFAKGPESPAEWELTLRRSWIGKMLERSEVHHVEAHYRRHWLLFDLLESYYFLRRQWYLGPKISFKNLAQTDPKAFSLFQKAMSPGATMKEIRDLAHLVLEV